MEKDPRKINVTTDSGKPVQSTQQLKGEAKESAAFKETNKTDLYSSGSSGKGGGPWGGEGTH